MISLVAEAPWWAAVIVSVLSVVVASPVVVALVNRSASARLDRIELTTQRVEASAAESHEQLVNDHDSNLRVDIDEVLSQLGKLADAVQRVSTKVDTLTETQTRHLLASEESDTATDRRVQQVVDRISDLSTRVRRVESRRGRRKPPDSDPRQED